MTTTTRMTKMDRQEEDGGSTAMDLLRYSSQGRRATSEAFVVNVMIAIAIMPIWTLVFYCRNFRKWQEEEFEEKYGAVFEGLRKSNRSSLGYPIIFILRRFALVLAIIIFENYLWAQITLMIFISMC